MSNNINNPIVAEFDILGYLTKLTYSDGSEMFGDFLEAYDAFMREKFGSEWEENPTRVRLCRFEEDAELLPEILQRDTKPGLDPDQFSFVLSYGPDGTKTRVSFPGGTALLGEAMAEFNAMRKEMDPVGWQAERDAVKKMRRFVMEGYSDDDQSQSH